MRLSVNQLKKIKTKIDDRLEERLLTYEHRSEGWKQNINGIRYNEENEELIKAIDNLKDAVTSINNFLD